MEHWAFACDSLVDASARNCGASGGNVKVRCFGKGCETTSVTGTKSGHEEFMKSVTRCVKMRRNTACCGGIWQSQQNPAPDVAPYALADESCSRSRKRDILPKGAHTQPTIANCRETFPRGSRSASLRVAAFLAVVTMFV